MGEMHKMHSTVLEQTLRRGVSGYKLRYGTMITALLPVQAPALGGSVLPWCGTILF